LNPNPDHPLQLYDSRAAFKSGIDIENSNHLPSRFKWPGHPTQFKVVDGQKLNTITGKPPTREELDRAVRVRKSLNLSISGGGSGSYGFDLTSLPESAQRLTSVAAGAGREFVRGLTLDIFDPADVLPELEELSNRFRDNVPIKETDPLVDRIHTHIKNDPNMLVRFPSRLLGQVISIGKISREVTNITGLPQNIKELMRNAGIAGIATGAVSNPGERDTLTEAVGARVKSAIKHGLFFAGVAGTTAGVLKVWDLWRAGKPKAFARLREEMYKLFIDERGYQRDGYTMRATDAFVDDLIEKAGGARKLTRFQVKRATRNARKVFDDALSKGPTEVRPPTEPTTPDSIPKLLEDLRNVRSVADVTKTLKDVPDVIYLNEAANTIRSRELVEELAARPLTTPSVGTSRERRAIKGRIRDITGQVHTDITTMKEMDALKLIMRRQAGAARKAFSEGRKKGISTLRTHQRLVKEARMIRKELNRRTQLAVRQIAKAVNTKVTPDYRKRLDAFTDGLDMVKGRLKKRSAKTIARRKGTLEFVKKELERGEDIPVSLETIAKAELVPLNDFTIDELEDLSRSVQVLAHQGKNKGKFLRLQQGRRIDAAVEENIAAAAGITGGKNPRPSPPFPPNTTEKMIKDAWDATKSHVRSFSYFDSRMERRMQELDSMKLMGANWNSTYAALNDARNTEVRGAFSKYNMLKEGADKFGIDIDKTFRTDRHVSNRVGTMKEADILGIVDSVQDVHKMELIMRDFNLTEEHIQDIVDSLKPNELQFLKWLRENVWDAYYPEINNVVEKRYGYTLNRTPGFSPRLVDVKTKRGGLVDQVQDRLEDQLWNYGRLSPRLADKPGTIKKRIKNATATTNLNLWDTVSAYIDEAEHFKAFAEIGRDIRQMIRHPNYRAMLDDKMGPEFFPQFDKWLANTISGKLAPENSYAAHIVRIGRERAVMQWLGLNVVSSGKAMVSILNSAGLMKNKHFQLSAMTDYMKDPKYWSEWVYERADQFRFRAGGERDLQAVFKQAQRGGLYKGETLDRLAYDLYKITDKAAVISSFIGHHRDFLKENPMASDEEASLYATMRVIRTQPAPDIKDLPVSFTEGELAKSMTTLRNQVNNNKEYFRHDIFKELKASTISSGEALQRFLWLSMTGVLIGSLTRGRLQRTPKEWAVDLTVPHLGGIFMASIALFNIINNYPTEIPIMGALSGIGRKIKAKEPLTWVEAGILSIALVTGVPLLKPSKYAKGIADIMKGRTDDPRRLLWSEGQLRLPKKKGIKFGGIPGISFGRAL
jgi:hypothetical protein